MVVADFDGLLYLLERDLTIHLLPLHPLEVDLPLQASEKGDGRKYVRTTQEQTRLANEYR